MRTPLPLIPRLAKAHAWCVRLQAADSLGRRERKGAMSYNENKSFQSMLMGTGIARSGGGGRKPVVFPKGMRLPRLDPWKFYNRARLAEIFKIQLV